MNILLINQYAGSPQMGMAFRPYYFAYEWQKLGHNVMIVAGDYSHLRNKNPNVKQDLEHQKIEGINYCWIKTKRYAGNGLNRAFNIIQFSVKAFFYSKKLSRTFKPDVVITSSTHPFDTYAGRRIAQAVKAKLVHEVHDLWPLTLIEIGGMSKYHPFIMLMQLAENAAYKKSDKVVSLAPFAKEHMMLHGMQEDKFVHIPNGIIIDEWKNPLPLPREHKEVLESLRKSGGMIIGYFGGHALSNNLEVVIRLAQKTKSENIEFVLVGEGIEKDRLLQHAQSLGLTNIHFLPFIEKTAIPTLCSYFDSIYFGAKDSPLYRFGICLNKMYDSMMSSKPIICAITAPKTPIEISNCGFVIASNDEEGILDSIRKIEMMTSEQRDEMGNRGKVFAQKKYNYTLLATQFLEVFQ